jgi:hypothetical protein
MEADTIQDILSCKSITKENKSGDNKEYIQRDFGSVVRLTDVKTRKVGCKCWAILV